ncbi:hypothetical protein HanPSC8_Chr16g0707681 [Helianthus annuus]|nr:hypothetical protein HanPSC8_Chr16g0707681 [Helianthus annuus]
MGWFGLERGLFRSGFGPTRVSARDGFQIATGFGPTRVSARDEFRSGRVSYRFDSYRFDT